MRSKSTTVRTEITLFIVSFVVILALINILWLQTVPGYQSDIISALIAANSMVYLTCIAEIAISVLIYYWRYGKSQVQSTTIRTEIMRFMTIFVAVFTIINVVWIDIWVIGWF